MTSAIGNNIVKFTGRAEGDEQITYHSIINDIADRSVKIDKYSLKTFFDRNFRIPDFQRGYEWEEEQWGELWAEIKPLFEAEENSANTTVRDVFFGSMFFAEREGDEVDQEESDLVYDIIDGQQRVTTLTILFKIVADKVQHCIEEETSLVRELGNETGNIRNLVYEDTTAGAEETPSLTLNRHNREFFEALMKTKDEQLKYLLQRPKVHGNTKYGAITVKQYLDKTGIESEEYLDAVNDEDYYEGLDDTTQRPNLTSTQKRDLEVTERDSLSPNDGLGKDLLSNKVDMLDDNQSLLEAYDYFESKLADELAKYETVRQKAFALVNMKNFIVYMFHVGYFEVKKDQPRLLMKIFEILNDRGIELKKADVMRTRVVARFRGEPSEKKYIDKWESVVSEFGNDQITEFLRTYFVVKGDASSRGELKNHLLEAFVRDPDNGDDRKLSSRLSTVEKAESFLDELTEYSGYYHDIVDPHNRGIDLGDEGEDEIESECNRIITRLEKASTSIWEPLVLAVYRDVVENEIGHQTKLLGVLRAVESMAIRKFAAMDTHTRDRAYAAAIKEYHNEGLEGDLVEELTDIETDDPNAIGERLVESLYQADWPKQWGKQVLRKIVSENFAGEEDPIVLRQLNLNDNLVHLEHILPRTPIRNDDEKYAWFEKFFRTTDETDLAEMVNAFIEQEDDETLDEIADKYKRDLGNLILLRSRENIKTGNSLFSQKSRDYLRTTSFCELFSSGYLCTELLSGETRVALNDYIKLSSSLNNIDEEWEDIVEGYDIEGDSVDVVTEEIESRLDELEAELEYLNNEWNYKRVTKNRTYLVKALCDSIAFDDSEFEDVDFESLSEEETETKNDIITANFRRRV